MSDFCFDMDADCPFDVDAGCPSSPEPAALCFRGCGRVTRSTFDEDGCVLYGCCTGCAIGGQHDPQCDYTSSLDKQIDVREYSNSEHGRSA